MTSKRNVVFITHYNEMNGANQSLYTLLKGLCDDYEIMVFIHNPGNKNEGLYRNLEDVRNVHVENVNLLSYLYFKNRYLGVFKLLLNFLLSIKGMRTILKYCRSKKVDLIYSNSSVESYGILLAKILGTKHVWHIREFGYLDYGLKHFCGNRFKRFLFQTSNLVIAISKSIESYVRTNNCQLIYNGVVDNDEIASVKSLIISEKGLKLGVVGLISQAKNQLIVIEAIKSLRDRGYSVHLDIWGGVGDQKYKNELQTFITKYKLEEFIDFKGFENNKDRIYSSMDLLVMSSPYEAFGRVTIEAMSRGIVVIGNNSAGTTELIEDNVSGLLYNGLEQLGDKIITMIEHKELYSILSNASIEQSKKFTIQRYIGSIYKSIKNVIEE